MLNNKTIAVVVPAYNEETQIGMVIENMPDFVDRIIVVNDCSTDNTEKIIIEYINNLEKEYPLRQPAAITSSIYSNKVDLVQRQRRINEGKNLEDFTIYNSNIENDRIILINLKKNSGVGAAIARGYKWCKDNEIDCTAVMAGDGQMDPSELESICSPVVFDGIDYVKGNRLIHRSALLVIPKIRYFGNSVLSIMTKIASGYWHVSDTQTGYTAIGHKALNSIRIDEIYKKYGMPNDMLVKLNIGMCTIKEVEIKPIYDIGEKSKMKIGKVIPSISLLLFKSFFKRLWGKYLFRDFHPLFILYNLGFLLGLFSLPLLIKTIKIAFYGGNVNPVTLLVLIFLLITSLQSILFAMWMDIQDNERLYK